MKGYGMTTHEQVPLLNPWAEREIGVDVGMQDFLEAVWSEGIYTTASCQEQEHGYAWVAFGEFADAIAFQNLTTEQEFDDLWERAHFVSDEGEGPHDRDFWHWTLCDPDGEVAGDVHVHFPASDIPLIVERARRARDDSRHQVKDEVSM